MGLVATPPVFGGSELTGVTSYSADWNPATSGPYTTPCVLVGRDVSVLVGGAWRDCNPNDTQSEWGIFNFGPPAVTSGTLESISYETDLRLEDISPMSIPATNAVPIEYSASVEITEILTTTGGVLYWLASNYLYANVAIQRGDSYTNFVGAIGSYTEGLRKGKSIGRMTLRSVIMNGRVSLYTNFGGYVSNNSTGWAAANAQTPVNGTFYTFSLTGV